MPVKPSPTSKAVAVEVAKRPASMTSKLIATIEYALYMQDYILPLHITIFPSEHDEIFVVKRFKVVGWTVETSADEENLKQVVQVFENAGYKVGMNNEASPVILISLS